MSSLSPTTRRDERYTLRRGSSHLILPSFSASGEAEQLSVTCVSVAGVAFEIDREVDSIFPGARLDGIELHIGSCVLRGDAQVRSLQDQGEAGFKVGCLFIPGDPGSEDRWFALIAGIEAAIGE